MLKRLEIPKLKTVSLPLQPKVEARSQITSIRAIMDNNNNNNQELQTSRSRRVFRGD